ncbi:MAG: hypothetical protein A3K19_21305 [Lentisphaerae bacterium RIFOXYB12_FULL_65_16]|nr:MAG: hypothetical protein A3K18_33980 [Lentisphaerae bacterium RIFOXYA12_64_32]OGV93670.1 MAG: hypothetical protein A3K19_21305 [Lentisphaerae bacterium RIFOXYB12_FULL_65_16]
MYHWYLLVKTDRARTRRTDAHASHFVAWGGPDPMGDLSAGERWTMAGLGAVEVVPFIGCPAVGPLLSERVPLPVWFLAGAALMAFVCWLLRNQVPQLPIHAAAAARDEGGAANVGRTAPACLTPTEPSPPTAAPAKRGDAAPDERCRR